MRSIETGDYRRLERLSSLAASCRGDCAYTVYFWQDDCWRRRVELMLNGEVRTISAGGICENEPAFSPDGKTLYFLSDGRVCAYECQTGNLYPSFVPEEGFEAYGFAVLETALAVKVRKEIREEAPEGCEWEMPLVATELRYRNDADHGFTKKYDRRLLLVQLGKEAEVLDHGTADWQHLTAAGGMRLVFAKGPWQMLDCATQETVCLDEKLIGTGCVPAISADGQHMLAACLDQESYEMQLRMFRLTGEYGSELVEHGADLVLCGGAYCDASPEKATRLTSCADGSWLAVMTSAAVPQLWRISPKDGGYHAEAFSQTGDSVFECAAGGRKLWALCGDASHAMELYSLSANGEKLGCAAEHNGWLKECHLQPYQRVEVPSLDGKTMLHGWVLLPEKTENAPVLLWIHGGPEGFFTDGMYLELQAAVGMGFAVVAPNPRGSTGYGSDYQNRGDAFGDGAATDVLMLLDAVLRAHPELDASRVGVLGGSYGGYMSARLAGTTKRFKAAVVIKPVTNWLFIHFKSSQSGQDVFENHRDFQDFLMDMLRQSPVYHAGDVEIPTLIIHGEKDQTCPVDNAHQFYVAVRDTHPDLPVRLMVMPDCCHGYSRDGVEDYIIIQNETLAWLGQYV